MSEMTTMYRSGTDLPAFVTGQTLPKNSHACPNREAALRGLYDSKPEHFDRLLALSPGEWRKVLRWLDVSGLTPYFADRMNELNFQGALPGTVNRRLQQSLSDNRSHMRVLLQEYVELQTEFQRATLTYAVVDRFSLCSSSVPMSELRYEHDLNLLVAESSASKMREILEQAGYCIYAMTGNIWEFKKNEAPGFSRNNLHKNGFEQRIELHIESVRPDRKSALSRREYREIDGVVMPVLGPADLFLRQGVLLFNEVCSSFLRASHLVEFYRNVCVHGDDPAFWMEVRELAEEDPCTVLALGVVLQLIESVMQGEIPSKLAMWTMLRLPAGVQRWIALYGLNCVYGMPPGTKLYLLLQQELETTGMVFTRSQREALELRSILPRLRFHLIQGIRYAWASYRWRQYRNGLSA